jgi:hypothetical protein
VTCGERQESAAGIVSLPADAPERRDSVAHARTCGACRAALAEGEALLRLLEEAQPAPVAEGVLVLAKAQILAELAAEAARGGARTAATVARGGAAWRPALATVAAVVGAYLIPLAGGRRLAGLAASWSIALAAAGSLVTGAALVLGGALFGAIPVLSGVASFLAGGAGPLDALIGKKCLLFELLWSLPPLLTGAVLAWRGPLPRRPWVLLAAAGGGALAGQAALGVLCHAHQSHAHLFTFHTGGVLAALVVGGLVSGLLTKLHPSRG